MTIKRNYLFFIDKEKDKKSQTGYKPDGKLRLRIRYSVGKIDFNVGYRVYIEKWNKESQRCTAGTTHGKKKVSATEINKEIQRLANIADDVFKTFEVKEHIPSLIEYREAFNDTNDKETKGGADKASFFYVFDLFVKDCGKQNNWTDATFEKFAAVKNHLEGFDKKVTFKSLNESRLIDYIDYLRDTKNLRNSTIGKQLAFLKWFLRWSLNKGYNNNNAFLTFKPSFKTVPKKVIFLTWKELMQLQDYKIPETKKYLERVRDVFLFSCFTSLRYSDVYNLKWSNIKEGYVEITTIKTIDSLQIDLNDYSSAILNKYKGYHFENNKVLPVITNQKMNDYLKELGELAEINESITEVYFKGNERIEKTSPKYSLLSTHAGRRTFICISLALGIPAQTVMKWTGHSDYKSMKPYIDISDEAKREAMKAWNKKDDDEEKLLGQLKAIPKEKLAELLKKLEI
ncbi:site-specific integrase [Dysgonomonas sp. 216]|uniref:site-specific integrase n=1 Tax=Dysgonomonas sp. 216 TaxID=2302934 RepID=UPI0013D886C1